MPFVGTHDGYGLGMHLNSHHYDLMDQYAGKSWHNPDHAKEMHDLHQQAHESGEGMAAYHHHLPDPNKPLLDDESINDDLAKHLVAGHGWSVGAGHFDGKSHDDLVQAHKGLHSTLDPDGPTLSHNHVATTFSALHTAPGGKQPVPPVLTHGISPMSGHLQTHHGWSDAKVQALLGEDKTGYEEVAALHDVHAQEHANPDLDLTHHHPDGLSGPEKGSVKQHLIGHLQDYYHGYKGPVENLVNHPDLQGFHASLHENPDLHKSAAFGHGGGSPHHHGVDLDHMASPTSTYDHGPHGWVHPDKKPVEPEQAESHWEDALLAPDTPEKHPHFDDLSPIPKLKHMVDFHGMNPHKAKAEFKAGTLSDTHAAHHADGLGSLLAVPHEHHEPQGSAPKKSPVALAPHHENHDVSVHDHLLAMHNVSAETISYASEAQKHDIHDFMHTHSQEKQTHHHPEGKPAALGHPEGWAPPATAKTSVLDVTTFFQMEAAR